MRPHRALRAVVEGLVTALLCLLICGVVSVVVAGLFGYRLLTVQSGSMAPTLKVGDVVVDSSVRPLEFRPGQIVTFRDPALGQVLVTHRVVSVHRVGHEVDFITKGDANVATEHWSIDVNGHLGRELFQIPAVGRILACLGSPLARALAVALVGLWLLYQGFKWIWREPSRSGVPATR